MIADKHFMTDLQPILRLLIEGRTLTEAQAERAFEILLSGAATDAQIGALLAVIAARPAGPTVDELVGAARVMRRCATPVPRPTTGPFAGAVTIDTCGTGGAPKLFNISTIAAIIVAAASDGRAMVCKHGNVSRTGRGSAELMRELGVKVDAAPHVQQRCLGEVGVCFSLAPAHHPAARHAAAARKSLGFITLFNTIGPLANPAAADRQLIGTWSHANARLMAQALARLGCKHALVCSSRDGLDELTTTDINLVHEVRDGSIHDREIDARDFGLPRRAIPQLQAADLPHAVRIARDVLAGQPSPYLEVSLFNAAAALWVAGAATDLAHGIDRAREAVHSGQAMNTLDRLVALSNA